MYIQLKGQILSYEKRGQGKDLILLHGNGEDHTIFDELCKRLEDSFTIYAIDTRGHGGSATPNEYHYREMAEDISLFISSLELDHPIVLGFSDGGILALLTAINHSDLLAGIIACGANRTPKGLQRKELHEIRRRARREKDPLAILMATEPDITDSELSRISCPSLIVAGERDLILPKETEAIVHAIPGARSRIFENQDHSSYVIHSTVLEKTVREFYMYL